MYLEVQLASLVLLATILEKLFQIILKCSLTRRFVRFTHMTSVPHHLCCECLLELYIYKAFGTSIFVAEYGLRADACFILDTGRLLSDVAVREDSVEKSRVVFYIEGRLLILLFSHQRPLGLSSSSLSQ